MKIDNLFTKVTRTVPPGLECDKTPLADGISLIIKNNKGKQIGAVTYHFGYGNVVQLVTKAYGGELDGDTINKITEVVKEADFVISKH